MTGEELKTLRLAHGLTQASLGEIVERSKYTIRSYENGQYKVPEEVAGKFEEWIASPKEEKVEENPKVQMTGEELKSLRLAHGLTQSSLGEIVGRSTSSIIYYEKGLCKIPEDVVMTFGTWIASRGEQVVVNPKVLMTREQLKSLRLAHGLTLPALGKIVGRSASTIAFYEKGLYKVPEEVAEKFEAWIASPKQEEKKKEKKKEKTEEKMTGEELKSIRLAQGLTQAALGKFVGRTKLSIINYEKGKTRVPEDVIRILEERFGISSMPSSAGGTFPDNDHVVAPENPE
ncbi:MAG: helix-turn-helix domain-containing protein [Aeriscardovia sp.]|nr:helix-turn-helix domain-containing protein [Aeriscardovia sp.]